MSVRVEPRRESNSLWPPCRARLGPVVAFRLVKQHLPKASLNLLWAMAAGLNGKDWRELSETTKMGLRKNAVE